MAPPISPEPAERFSPRGGALQALSRARAQAIQLARRPWLELSPTVGSRHAIFEPTPRAQRETAHGTRASDSFSLGLRRCRTSNGQLAHDAELSRAHIDFKHEVDDALRRGLCLVDDRLNYCLIDGRVFLLRASYCLLLFLNNANAKKVVARRASKHATPEDTAI